VGACIRCGTVSTRALSLATKLVSVRGVPDDPHGGFDGSAPPHGLDRRGVRSAGYSPPEIAHPRPSGEGYQLTQAPLAGRDDDVSTATLLREWALAAYGGRVSYALF